MKADVEKALRQAVRNRNSTRVLEIVKHEYEFKCESFVYAGPGHQSRHTCEQRYPHPLDDEHSDSNTEWKGTSVAEFEEVEARGLVPVGGHKYMRIKKLISNAPHTNNGCGCGW